MTRLTSTTMTAAIMAIMIKDMLQHPGYCLRWHPLFIIIRQRAHTHIEITGFFTQSDHMQAVIGEDLGGFQCLGKLSPCRHTVRILLEDRLAFG